MPVNTKRPVNLDLMSIKFPPMAIASILHRISGILMFILTPVLLCYLGQSLQSMDSFDALQNQFAHPLNKLVLWTFASAWAYHLLAGIRHLVMDFGVAESVKAGRVSSIIVIILGILSMIILGILIW